MDERASLAHRSSGLSPPSETPRRRAPGRALPAPERRFPPLGELLPPGDSGDAPAPALAPRGGSPARPHPGARAERRTQRADRCGAEEADGRDPEGTRRPARGPERRVLPGERAYPAA